MKIAYCLLLVFLLFAAAICFPRSLYNSEINSPQYNIGDPPYATIAIHNIGRIAMTISNYGVIGVNPMMKLYDPITGEEAPSMNYPKGYSVDFLAEAGLWVGAIVGRDTLVTTSAGSAWGVREFWPLPYPEGDIRHRSTNDPYSPEFDSSVSQQDFIAIYTDTIDDVDITGYDYDTQRIHRPLNIQVTQRSYSWGYDYADDFILLDFEIANISLRDLQDVYVGLYVDNDIGKLSNPYRFFDDICGFRKAMRSKYIAGLIDTLDIVWAADNDGDPDPISGAYAGLFAPTSAVATKVLRIPTDRTDFAFNWWISSWDESYDWGPRRNQPGGVRQFLGGRLGHPMTDEDKYYMMASKEFDYNQTEAYYDRSAEGWLSPPANAAEISSGADIKYLLSFGPFDMNPGDALPLTVAFVAGQDFYSDGMGPGKVRKWRSFDSLQLNTLWATWVFDNPGVDSDGDGNRGKYHIFCLNPKISRIDTIINSPADTIFDTVFTCLYGDTMFYQGDGVPDFRGALPPERPEIKTFPRVNEFNEGEIVIKWNGFKTETGTDQFSQKIDFEGYRVYTSRSGNPTDFTLVNSYDMQNYDRFAYDASQKIWEVRNLPYSIGVLRDMYGENFDPDPYFDEDHLFAYYNSWPGKWEFYYFSRHDWNRSDLSDTMSIHKVYPDQPYPSTLNLDTAMMFYPDEVTPEGQLKYFEYEYVMRKLLPSFPYYVTVTAFDHGVPTAGLRPLETRPYESAVREFAQNSSILAEERNLKVVVYPNPYRIDGNYREFYEGWEDPKMSAERTRALHFTNLPHKCTIRVFSIDGDLIREIGHDFPAGAPGSMHDTWNLVSRNDMTITSGIYYYTVESEFGTQVGKFVVIY